MLASRKACVDLYGKLDDVVQIQKERDAERARRAAEKWKKKALRVSASTNAEADGGDSASLSPLDKGLFSIIMQAAKLSKERAAKAQYGRRVSSVRRASHESNRSVSCSAMGSPEETGLSDGYGDGKEPPGSRAQGKRGKRERVRRG